MRMRSGRGGTSVEYSLRHPTGIAIYLHLYVILRPRRPTLIPPLCAKSFTDHVHPLEGPGVRGLSALGKVGNMNVLIPIIGITCIGLLIYYIYILMRSDS